VGKQSNEQGVKSGPLLARSNKAMDFEQIQSYNQELTRKQTTEHNKADSQTPKNFLVCCSVPIRGPK
jgi:hypothetical protein